MTLLERLLRAVLRLAPREFRVRYGHEVVETYRERKAASRGLSRLGLAVREVAGAVWLVIRLRMGAGLGEPRVGAYARERRASWVDGLGQDIRFAGRTLRRNPGY